LNAFRICSGLVATAKAITKMTALIAICIVLTD
jgi:hypothetical protein